MNDSPRPVSETHLKPSGMPEKGILRSTLTAVGFSIVVFLIVIAVVPDKTGMLAVLRRGDWRYLAAGLACLALALWFDAFRLWWLCKGIGSEVPFPRVVQGILASNFVSLVTPFVSGGAPCIIWVLQQSGVDMSRASAAVVAGGVVSQSMLVALSVVVPILSGIHQADDPFAHMLSIGARTVVPLYLLGVVLVVVGSLRIEWAQRTISSWDRRLQKAVRARRLAVRLRRLLRGIGQGLRGYNASFKLLATERPSVLIRAYGCSALYFMGMFTVGYLVFRAFGADVGYLRAVSAQMIILLVASATPTPGGAGASELGAYSLFVQIMPKEAVGAFVLVWRILTYWLLLLTGAIALGMAVRASAQRYAQLAMQGTRRFSSRKGRKQR
ncbi:MAG: lysylphosphatidylglycerol synthase transmembrane domain-containing protein [Bacillota bacterium]|nr:lysylphosphatidylglycerol synthase transmembrane domain-containing protein [Bacillota bacterium]